LPFWECAYRLVKLKYQDDPISGEGAIRFSGRYHLGQDFFDSTLCFKAVYLSDSEETASLEINRKSSQIDKADYVFFSVEVFLTQGFIDLTNPENQAALGTNLVELSTSWLVTNSMGTIAPTQKIALAAYRLGNIEGLKVPSVANPQGYNLVMFPDCLASGSYLRAFDYSGNLVQERPISQ
jgi:RES domain-containing protein